MGLGRSSAARVVVGAALGVATMLGAAAPALAAPVAAPANQQGVILKYIGTTRLYANCVDMAILAQRQEHADGWQCNPDNGQWSAYVAWYT